MTFNISFTSACLKIIACDDTNTTASSHTSDVVSIPGAGWTKSNFMAFMSSNNGSATLITGGHTLHYLAIGY